MANSIRRIPFLGTHINLAAIQSVSDAQFIDRMGSGGWFVGFSITMELVDQPLVFEWEAAELGGVRFVQTVGHQVQFVSGDWGRPDQRPAAELVPVRNLQRQIDEQLIPSWHAARGGGTEQPPRDVRMRYLGALGVLADCSVHVPEDVRSQIERVMEDACRHDPGLTWRRVLDRIDIEVRT